MLKIISPIPHFGNVPAPLVMMIVRLVHDADCVVETDIVRKLAGCYYRIHLSFELNVVQLRALIAVD